MTARSEVGVVVIGRNEGDRLRACLTSVVGRGRPVVYVDSGSTDSSVKLARSFGAEVVELDPWEPFTAARARNEGWRRLNGVQFVQFVDGDCEVDAGWIATAEQYLRADPDVVAICGRRRERHPEASVYNRLCDLEWDTPLGQAEACGGDAMFRQAALRAAGGYRDAMIAGEEPELCGRLRRAGGQVMRIDAAMTLHDAAMTTLGQWWARAVRAGHAFAEGARLTRGEPAGLWRREVRSTWFWALAIPAAAVLPTYWTYGTSLVLLLTYPLLWLKIAVRASRGWPWHDAMLYATFALPAKFAHLVGVLRFHRNRLAGRRGRIIEYKRPAAPAAAPP